MARYVFLSPSQLHRKLVAPTGYSAGMLIRLIRLNESKRLLRQTDLPISSIAYDCGFSKPDYFSTVFKKEFGQTPSKFREGYAQVKED